MVFPLGRGIWKKSLNDTKKILVVYTSCANGICKKKTPVINWQHKSKSTFLMCWNAGYLQCWNSQATYWRQMPCNVKHQDTVGAKLPACNFTKTWSESRAKRGFIGTFSRALGDYVHWLVHSVSQASFGRSQRSAALGRDAITLLFWFRSSNPTSIFLASFSCQVARLLFPSGIKLSCIFICFPLCAFTDTFYIATPYPYTQQKHEG